MSDDLNKKIKQVADLLGQESVPDNLMGLISMLAGSMGKESPSEEPEAEERSSRNEADDGMDMMRMVKQVMDRVKVNNDPRINLLHALRPFMSHQRQKKLDSCIKLLHMSSLAKLLDEREKII